MMDPAFPGQTANGNAAGHLRDVWYYGVRSRDLRAGRLHPVTLLGEDLIIGRDPQGKPFCLVDLCPHRGIPLRFGSFREGRITCGYHGWQFGTDGGLQRIPSLAPDQKFDFRSVCVKSYPCREEHGNVWVYMAAGGGAGQRPVMPDHDIPPLPDADFGPLRIYRRQLFRCSMDQTVIGLVDPAHGPYVHSSWWWRRPQGARLKEKTFIPSELGFTMRRHPPSANSPVYRLLGGTPQTEITFRLPGFRLEHIEAGRHHLVIATTMSPVGPTETMVHHLMYWTNPWLTLLTPVIGRFATVFLGQDRTIFTRQQMGLKHNPPLRLVDDADTLAKWYLRLKREHARARQENRPFVNPIQETTLRWTS